MLTQFDNLPGTARIWIYQSSRLLSDAEADMLLHEASRFIENWTAHQANLKGGATVVKNRFLIFGVDENYNDASGCSIDKKVNFVKEIGKKLEIDFFDRMRIAFEEDKEIKTEIMHSFTDKIRNGEISTDTKIYNNLIQTKSDLQHKWLVPVKESWLQQMI
jgi:hypothetical protein